MTVWVTNRKGISNLRSRALKYYIFQNYSLILLCNRLENRSFFLLDFLIKNRRAGIHNKGVPHHLGINGTKCVFLKHILDNEMCFFLKKNVGVIYPLKGRAKKLPYLQKTHTAPRIGMTI